MNENRAVVLSHNWETGETLHTQFEGPDAGIHANQFLAGIEDDFPEPEHVWTIVVLGAEARLRLGRWRLGLDPDEPADIPDWFNPELNLIHYKWRQM